MNRYDEGKRTLFEANNLIQHLEKIIRSKDEHIARLENYVLKSNMKKLANYKEIR